jgi:CheY-like chemotaxis protein
MATQAQQPLALALRHLVHPFSDSLDCSLEAGASDYLAKPVNTDRLLATLRLWLHR